MFHNTHAFHNSAEDVTVDFARITLDQIEAALDENGPALMLFSAHGCPPCDKMYDALQGLNVTLSAIPLCYVVAIDEVSNLQDPRLRELGIRHFPTLVLYERGVVLGALRGAVTKSGPVTKERLGAWIGNALAREPVPSGHAA